MPAHLLGNFEIQKYYQNEPKFNAVYSRNNLPNIKVEAYGAYAINLDEFRSIGIHWIALYVNVNNIIYFDSFGVEHIPKKKSENSLVIKILQQIFTENKQMI